MKEQDLPADDRRNDVPSESNTGKHVQFRKVEDENAEQLAGKRGEDTRQQEVGKEGRDEHGTSAENGPAQSAIPLDNDETIGIP